MNYDTWRATYQNSEQAARAAFDAAQRSHQQLQETRQACLALDANLQTIIAAAIAQGPGPGLQAAIDEMPTHSLEYHDAEVQLAVLEQWSTELRENAESATDNGYLGQAGGMEDAADFLAEAAGKLRAKIEGGNQ